MGISGSLLLVGRGKVYTWNTEEMTYSMYNVYTYNNSVFMYFPPTENYIQYIA